MNQVQAFTAHAAPRRCGPELPGPELPGPRATPGGVRSQLIGREALVQTPFGKRRVTYADHVASGRALQWVEDFIAVHVLPMYANAHTEDSATGARMTALARD